MMDFQPYGICISVGMLCAGVVSFFLSKASRTNWYEVILLAAYMCSFGIIGAKIFYLLLNIKTIEWDRIWEADYFRALMQGGFVFYGCLPGGLLGMVVTKRCHSVALEKPVRVFFTAFPLAHAFGRVGCAIVGCCYGVPYHGPLAIYYHSSRFAPNDIALFPVQLLEVFALLLLFGMMLFLFFKEKPGIVLLYCYVMSYSIIRFWLEYFRGDAARGHFLFFSTSQWISVAIAVTTSVVLLLKLLSFSQNGTKQ